MSAKLRLRRKEKPRRAGQGFGVNHFEAIHVENTNTTQCAGNTTPVNATPIQHIDVAVELVDGHPTTTSLAVAERFGKLHKDVLKRIASLDCSPDFHKRNFAPMIVKVTVGKGAVREEPAFRMTRDGFTFLCMGFTGKEAAKFKEAYINAFNQMEAALAESGAPLMDTAEQHRRLAFETIPIGLLCRDGRYWFGAASLVNALRIRGYSDRITRGLPEQDKCIKLRGRQKMVYISPEAAMRAADMAEPQRAERYRVWLRGVLAELRLLPASATDVNDRDLACLYALCEASERVMRAHNDLAPVLNAMRSNALIGVPAALEAMAVGTQYLQNKFGERMQVSARLSGVGAGESSNTLGVQLSAALGQPPLPADQCPGAVVAPLRGEVLEQDGLCAIERFGLQQLQEMRLLLSLDHFGVASTKPVPRDAMVMTAAQLAGAVSDPITVPVQYLPDIINAAVARLSQCAAPVGGR
ncbi:MAG: Rha family transcriptional regulator [Pseudomonas sp.]|nr:Rha family transcriptional regulator [Pseudomonas sp.]